MFTPVAMLYFMDNLPVIIIFDGFNENVYTVDQARLMRDEIDREIKKFENTVEGEDVT